MPESDETRLELELSDSQKQEYAIVVRDWELAIDQFREDISHRFLIPADVRILAPSVQTSSPFSRIGTLPTCIPVGF